VVFISEFFRYIKFKISKLFKKSSLFNTQTAYLLSFIISIWGGYKNDKNIILIGLVLFLLFSIYIDFKTGNWRGDERKEYGRFMRKDLKPLRENYERKITDDRDKQQSTEREQNT
jgi:hypothetical protein